MTNFLVTVLGESVPRLVTRSSIAAKRFEIKLRSQGIPAYREKAL